MKLSVFIVPILLLLHQGAMAMGKNVADTTTPSAHYESQEIQEILENQELLEFLDMLKNLDDMEDFHYIQHYEGDTQ